MLATTYRAMTAQSTCGCPTQGPLTSLTSVLCDAVAYRRADARLHDARPGDFLLCAGKTGVLPPNIGPLQPWVCEWVGTLLWPTRPHPAPTKVCEWHVSPTSHARCPTLSYVD